MTRLTHFDNHAINVLRKTGVDTAPVPIHLVAQRLGLMVESVHLGDEVSGVLVVDGEVGVIGYNVLHAEVRQRFTIAHEIGHYLLHRSDSSLFIDQRYFSAFRDARSSEGSEPREREANAFAASLLMPSHLVRWELKHRSFDLADEDALSLLAKTFRVSTQAMAFRLSNLGLFVSPD
jgi:Zn-dependent peptidase ImmA (M78 family)